jgi:hypothetical protein
MLTKVKLGILNMWTYHEVQIREYWFGRAGKGKHGGISH